jgi:hypothetical protein
MPLAIGLYGLYLLLVAINGNGRPFATALQGDAPGFLPWLIAAGVLGVLYEYDETRRFATLFLLLIVIAYVLKNFAKLQSQFAPIYNSSVAAPGTQVATAAGAAGTTTPQLVAGAQAPSVPGSGALTAASDALSGVAIASALGG